MGNTATLPFQGKPVFGDSVQIRAIRDMERRMERDEKNHVFRVSLNVTTHVEAENEKEAIEIALEEIDPGDASAWDEGPVKRPVVPTETARAFALTN